MIGGHEGTRTPNFLLVREAVYQLTYMPKNCLFGGISRKLSGAKFERSPARSFEKANLKLTKMELFCQGAATTVHPPTTNPVDVNRSFSGSVFRTVWIKTPARAL